MYKRKVSIAEFKKTYGFNPIEKSRKDETNRLKLRQEELKAEAQKDKVETLRKLIESASGGGGNTYSAYKVPENQKQALGSHYLTNRPIEETPLSGTSPEVVSRYRTPETPPMGRREFAASAAPLYAEDPKKISELTESLYGEEKKPETQIQISSRVSAGMKPAIDAFASRFLPLIQGGFYTGKEPTEDTTLVETESGAIKMNPAFYGRLNPEQRMLFDKSIEMIGEALRQGMNPQEAGLLQFQRIAELLPQTIKEKTVPPVPPSFMEKVGGFFGGGTAAPVPPASSMPTGGRNIIGTGRDRKTGRRVIQYDNGNIEYAD